MYADHNSSRTPSRLARWMVLCIVTIGCTIPKSFAVRRKSPSMPLQSISKAHLSVEDGRPLAKAIEVLESRYGWVITYEDPRYAYSGEIKDVTLSVRRDLDKYKPGEAPKVLVPKGGPLTFDYDVKSDTDLPSSRETVVRELLKAQAVSGKAGRFRLENTSGLRM
jgi:hypothetical protein